MDLKKEIKIKCLAENGITLIALVITIIVLLILAGVSISILAGDNGIIEQSQHANRSNIEGNIKEKINLWNIEVQMAKNSGSELTKTADDIVEEIEKTEGYGDVVIMDGYTAKFNDGTTLTISKPGNIITFNLVVACGGSECYPKVEKCEALVGMTWRQWISSGMKGTEECSMIENDFILAKGIHTESCPVVNNDLR